MIQDVRNLIDTANSHSNVLNDLVLAASTDPGEDRRERDRPLLAELKNEMLQVKDMFPGLLEKLSTLKTPESEQLMVQALEAHEQIEVCLDMERQVSLASLFCIHDHAWHALYSCMGLCNPFHGSHGSTNSLGRSYGTQSFYAKIDLTATCRLYDKEHKC